MGVCMIPWYFDTWYHTNTLQHLLSWREGKKYQVSRYHGKKVIPPFSPHQFLYVCYYIFISKKKEKYKEKKESKKGSKKYQGCLRDTMIPWYLILFQPLPRRCCECFFQFCAKKMAKIVIFRFFRDTIYIEGVAKRERLTQLEGNYKPLDRERG